MGIPSYFNYVLKNHTKIIKRLNQNKCHELFIDANSIIYDVVKTNEENINQRVYETIMELINKLKPTFTFVAFDGVAPLAKMKQQKQRRYKSWVTKQIIPSNNWNTNAITPGTTFMNELDLFLEKKFKSTNVLFSGTNTQGEGEHKIMEYIRNNKSDLNQMIYGLDADLIMLGLLHLKFNKNLFLYRETKHFSYLNNIDINVENNGLDLSITAQISEYLEMPKNDAINNYCFLCYLFGNDFLPHNPSLNIRNNGIQYLLELYKLNKYMIIKDNKIQWGVFKKLCIELSNTEHERIQTNIIWKKNLKTTPLNKEEELNFLPIKDMIRENYISLHLDQYNKLLFGQSPEQPCKNYLKMLEWTWSYYSGICKDHYVCYEFNVAPLFKDMIKYIPCFNEDILDYNTTPPPIAIAQLLYVLPYQDFHLVPFDTTHIITKFPNLTDTQFKIHYDFCKFFWESHVEFTYISFKELNNYCMTIKK